MNTKEITETIGATKGCKFASVTYRAKGSNELARHTLLLGASLESAYESDLLALRGKFSEVRHEVMKKAIRRKGESMDAFCQRILDENVELKASYEMIKSIENSLTKGIGNNDAYTQKGVWKPIAKNVRLSEDGRIQITGMVVGKDVIEEGIHKKVNSRPLTIAKKRIRKELELKASRIRTFSVDTKNIKRVAANRETITIE